MKYENTFWKLELNDGTKYYRYVEQVRSQAGPLNTGDPWHDLQNHRGALVGVKDIELGGLLTQVTDPDEEGMVALRFVDVPTLHMSLVPDLDLFPIRFHRS